jgi:hypothetical protein
VNDLHSAVTVREKRLFCDAIFFKKDNDSPSNFQDRLGTQRKLGGKNGD